MAACGSFKHIFENPLPENPSLIESLSSRKQIKPAKPISHSFTELFGELHFKENPHLSSLFPSSSPSPSPSSPPPPPPSSSPSFGDVLESTERQSFPVSSYSTRLNGDGFSPLKSESLQLCTEGLGCESLDDFEDLKTDTNSNNNKISCDSNGVLSGEKACARENSTGNMGSFDQYRRSKSCSRTFPPPISCIGRSGKPWVCFKSYCQDGRFVLQEVRIPTQEFLHASREDGKLRLRFVQPESYLTDQEEDENDDEEEYSEEVIGGEEDEKSPSGQSYL